MIRPVSGSLTLPMTLRTQAMAAAKKSDDVKGAAAPSAGKSKDADLLLVSVHPESGCGHIQLNRPAALNALNAPMIARLSVVLAEWLKDSKVRFVLLTSASEKAFCAGGDIISLAKPPHPLFREEFFRDEYTINHMIATYPKPFVSVLPGFVMGGGVGLSVHGTFRVVTDNTRFAMPETEICLFPDVGASYFLPRLKAGPAVGMYLGLTGTVLSAADCMYAGIGTHYVPQRSLALVTSALRDSKLEPEISVKSHLVHILNSFAADAGSGKLLSPYADLIARTFGTGSAADNKLQPSYDAVVAALTAEANDTQTWNAAVSAVHSTATTAAAAKWCRDTLSVLSRKSPTSLDATVVSLNFGARADTTLAVALQFEYRLAVRITKFPDFFEGVRALVIDKDKKPKWKPRPSAQSVLAFFAPFRPDTESVHELILPPAAAGKPTAAALKAATLTSKL